MKKYYSMVVEGKEADIYIFGDITSWEWLESDVSSYTLAQEIQNLDVDIINVHINSYGGEVAEGLAIYNMLKNHKAKIVTICDGFACSIASVIFMAGEERIMNAASLLMIHNAWVWAAGNANELRKVAEDLEKITTASVNAYLSRVTITEEELKTLMDDESWILPDDAIEMGFASMLEESVEIHEKAAANVRQSVFRILSEKTIIPEGSDSDEPEDDEEIDSDNDANKNDESDETETDDQADDTESGEANKSDEEATQKLSSFFNALNK